MKIFKVTIDNKPGGWKSGEDPSVLVIAKTKEEAFKKVRNGWGDKWDYKYDENDGVAVTTYMQSPPDKGYNLVKNDSRLSAHEIRFEGFDVHIKNPRQAKLDRIEKNIKREIMVDDVYIKKENPIVRMLVIGVENDNIEFREVDYLCVKKMKKSDFLKIYELEENEK